MPFSYRKSLTLTASQAGTVDSSNWPLTIALDGNVQAADLDLRTVANGGFVQNANGYDIRPFSDINLTTALTFEIVYYNASAGQLEMHVNIPTLSTTNNTVIYLAFWNVTLSSDGSSTGTWDSSYKLVLHLKDGTTLSVADSTASAYSSSNTGMTAAAGKIDGGANSDGSAGNRITVTNGSNTISGDNTYTISEWIKPASLTEVPVLWNIFSAAPLIDLFAEIGAAIAYWGDTVLSAYNTYGNSSFSNGTWYHLTWIKTGSGSAGTFYINAIAQTPTVTAIASTPTGANINLVISDYQSPTFEFNGVVDEFRISDTDRSLSWITAEYNAQKASSTFIVWGAKQIPGSGARRFFMRR